MSTDATPQKSSQKPRRQRNGVSLHAFGEPVVWAAGGALALAILMITVLMAVVLWNGLGTFWPKPIHRLELHDGRRLEALHLGTSSYILDRQRLSSLADDAQRLRALAAAAKVTASDLPSEAAAQSALVAAVLNDAENATPGSLAERLRDGLGKPIERLQLRRCNKYLYGDAQWLWVDRQEIVRMERPSGLVLTEGRGDLGRSRMIGTPIAILKDGQPSESSDTAAVFAAAQTALAEAEARWRRRHHLQEAELGSLARSRDNDLRELRYRSALLADEALRTRSSRSITALEGFEQDLLTILAALLPADVGLRTRFLALATEPAPSTAWQEFAGSLPEAAANAVRAALPSIERLGVLAQTERQTDNKAYVAAFDAYWRRVWASQEQQLTIATELAAIKVQEGRIALRIRHADGETIDEPMGDLVRVVAANDLSVVGSIGVYLSRWWEFLFHDPRNANSEGGVLPAIIGTVAMTLAMTLVVVPFGVLAALYLREYAKDGPVVTAIRIAINNLAGVPSIVYGVFGLAFFCYFVGVGLDAIFYPEYAQISSQKFAKGGVFWAALTLSLMTLPVVIVATEEAITAVPKSMREGSYGCGASKWQTIERIVLPRAMPGILTGAILAMARGAGEVAPLMVVGAVKLAPALPIDLGDWSGSLAFLPTGPLHLDRSFMHLGFHIYDVGFQSQDSEAAKPMVYTTTLLLIGIVTILNILAILLRNRLRRRFAGSSF